MTEIDGVMSIPAAATVGKPIGDQLYEKGMSWKSYQESRRLPEPTASITATASTPT